MSPARFCGPMFMHQIQRCCPQSPEVHSLALPHTLWKLGPSPGCWASAPACRDISLYITACASVYGLTGVSDCLCTLALSHYLVWFMEELWHHVHNNNNPFF